MRLTHITTGQTGIHAETSTELATLIATAESAGYVVTDITDDPTEPWHVATIHYTGGPQTLRTLRQLLTTD